MCVKIEIPQVLNDDNFLCKMLNNGIMTQVMFSRWLASQN